MSEAPSPFLPGTKLQFAWDSTSLGWLKTCPRLYQYIMLDGWSPKGESIHLRFGQEYHSTLEDYDRTRASGAAHEDALRSAILALYTRTFDWVTDPDTKAGKYKNRSSILSLTIDYLDKFANDPAETYIKDDGVPAVELSFRFELEWGPINEGNNIDWKLVHDSSGQADVEHKTKQPYLLSGHLDRVVRFNDELFVMDRKTTTTTLSSYYFNAFAPNNQMTLYSLASKVVLGTTVRGVIIDAAQIKLSEPNHFDRGFTYRTPDQLEEWLHDLRFWLAQAESYAEADYWPMNDTSCDKFGGCRFREICSKSPSVRERFLASNFDKLSEDQRWNPLKPR